MTAADTSLVVAVFASWHEHHATAQAALTRDTLLPAHVAVEVYSVLTRLPPPHRARSGDVIAFLQARFPGPYLALPASRHLEFLELAHANGITGGAVYDARIGATAVHAAATLLTRDHRAVRAYEAVGARYEMVA